MNGNDINNFEHTENKDKLMASGNDVELDNTKVNSKNLYTVSFFSSILALAFTLFTLFYTIFINVAIGIIIMIFSGAFTLGIRHYIVSESETIGKRISLVLIRISILVIIIVVIYAKYHQ